jgi:hypothetical protein
MPDVVPLHRLVTFATSPSILLFLFLEFHSGICPATYPGVRCNDGSKVDLSFFNISIQKAASKKGGWKMPIFAPIQTHGAANTDEGDIFPPHPEHYTPPYPTELSSLTPYLGKAVWVP